MDFLIGYALQVKAHPEVRFVLSIDKPADQIVEVPVESASASPFDPHERSSAELLKIFRMRLWEESRIKQGERGILSRLLGELTARMGIRALGNRWRWGFGPVAAGQPLPIR